MSLIEPDTAEAEGGRGMRNRDIPEPEATGLSTDDLAGARQDADAGPEVPPAADVPPEFPGEATTADREGVLAGERPAEPGVEKGTVPGAEKDAEKGTETAGREAAAEEQTPLLGSEEEEFRSRWQKIQSDFVDAPRDSVGAADTLVAEAMQALATSFSEQKQDLEEQWQRGEEVPTEDLRVALQRYRSFFNRLLST